jgi:hypothetical protein
MQLICLHLLLICRGKLTVSVRKTARGKININAFILIPGLKNNKKDGNFFRMGQAVIKTAKYNLILLVSIA